MLIAIEGVDASGKSTQAALLRQRLERKSFATCAISFPRYADPVFGEPIKRFLSGEHGDAAAVDPWLVALLFASDRGAAAPSLRQALSEGRVVICDRYFHSNLAYQAAKLGSEREVGDFARWLRELELGHFAIPAPDCAVYLDVHEDERLRRLHARASSGEDLGGAIAGDVHERDSDLQARVEEVFRAYARTHADLTRIDCHEGGTPLDREAVHERIWQTLVAHGLPDARTLRP
jgi:dTMP kinase